jgi:hypothetical protein
MSHFCRGKVSNIFHNKSRIFSPFGEKIFDFLGPLSPRRGVPVRGSLTREGR